DKCIIDLDWARNERAIRESERKYRSLCSAIALSILGNREDTEECVNDTWLAAWNSIPPHKPERLDTYLGKLTRNLALKKHRDSHRDKRGGGEIPLALDELADCIPGGADPQKEYEERELAALLDHFLDCLPETERQIFLRRYWLLEPIAALAESTGFTPSKVASMLHRTRKKLRKYLDKEGYAP
ncbi:MAG: sigma-70 family RNA polymerase sigma factor, partial [Clostridia bacterium]|nr:sigma-70 family RNA polymerase sigma factor [Clostridia bacterium]